MQDQEHLDKTEKDQCSTDSRRSRQQLVNDLVIIASKNMKTSSTKNADIVSSWNISQKNKDSEASKDVNTVDLENVM